MKDENEHGNEQETTSTPMLELTAFEQGWLDGVIGNAEPTSRLASERFPSFTDEQITAYLNGVEDGIKGDTFRIDKSLGERVRKSIVDRETNYKLPMRFA